MHNFDDLTDPAFWVAFLKIKYVQRSDERQREMGLSYTTAGTFDLAKQIANVCAMAQRTEDSNEIG